MKNIVLQQRDDNYFRHDVISGLICNPFLVIIFFSLRKNLRPNQLKNRYCVT